MTILFFFLIINSVAYVVLNAQTNGAYLFPGVKYTQTLNGTGNITDYENKFNATGMVEDWQAVGSYGFAGDIFSGLNLFWNVFRFLVDGLGMTLEWIGSVIPVAETGFTWIAYIIRIACAVMFVTLVIELITGRQFFD